MLLRAKREAMRRVINSARKRNMTAQELAALLNGREYRFEIDQKEEADAKASGLVVVFGASDDLMEFRGAIYDEIGAYDGATVRVDGAGLLPFWEFVLDQEDEQEAERYFERKRAGFQEIHAIWCPPELPDTSWRFDTAIPHATFDVMEGEDIYCRGIVFALADVKGTTA